MKTSSMKSILVFKDGLLHRQIFYKTKNDAKRNYSGFIKHGMADPCTGEKMENLHFELL